MAKLLLSCDDYIYCYKGRYYARTQEKYDFYQRYLRVFDRLRIVTRCVHEKSLGKSRVLLDDPRIEYVPMPFFSGPAQYAKVYWKIGKRLKGITTGCDAAILRLPSTIAQRVCKKVMKTEIPYATELVFDAKDAMDNAANMIGRMIWKTIHQQMVDACNHANGVACVTEHAMQRHYSSKRKDAFYSHYSSLALQKSFYTSARQHPNKKVLTIAHVCTQVQYNGRKGHNEIIEAIALLKEKGICVQVDFVGPDYHDSISKLKRLAQKKGVIERVSFIGGVNREQLSRFLEQADLYVMPTWAEGLPRVVIEAMAKGLPVITTPISGNPELVSNHFLVPYTDIRMLAQRIEELIKNPILYEQTSRDNYCRSLEYEATVLQGRRDEFYLKLKKLL